MSRVWLITGTSSGLGRRIATTALSRGDRVIATGKSLSKLQQALPSNPNLHLVELDVTSGTEIINPKIAEAAKLWGRIDVVVNNAGIGIPALLEEGGSKMMREQFNTNVFGLMDVTNATLPTMRAQRSGTVVLVGSRSSWRTEIPGLGPYSASKIMVRSYGETLSVELAPFNIRVMIVEPGGLRTEGIHSQNYYVSNALPDYDAMRSKSIAFFGSIPGNERGDPDKAAVAIVDVVNGEGQAEGRGLPRYLVLGSDAEAHVKEKINKVSDTLEAWKDVTRGTDFEVNGPV